MTRPIKFRAYDKRGKVMLPEIVAIDFKLKKIVCGSIDMPIALSFYDVELLQFTGLTDKNGKEIYEGDVIDVHDTTMGTEDVVRGEVYWCDSYLQWSIQWLPKQSGADSMRLVKKSLKKNAATPESSLGNRRWPFLEVIGNLYENPALLQ